jgi:hypothetical protein
VDWIYLVLDRGKVWGSFQHGNELSGSVRSGKVLEYLRYCWLLKKASARWR